MVCRLVWIWSCLRAYMIIWYFKTDFSIAMEDIAQSRRWRKEISCVSSKLEMAFCIWLILSNVLCCWLFVSAGQLLPARRSRLFTQESSRLPSSWRPAEPAASLLCCRWNCASISLHSARGLRWCSPGVELEWLFPLLVPCQSSCQKLTAGETVPAFPCTLHVVTFQ